MVGPDRANKMPNIANLVVGSDGQLCQRLLSCMLWGIKSKSATNWLQYYDVYYCV